jgi:hypothetical protein
MQKATSSGKYTKFKYSMYPDWGVIKHGVPQVQVNNATMWTKLFVELQQDFIVFNENVSCYCHAGAMGERRYSSYSFLTLELDGGEWSVSRPATFYPQERTTSTNWIGGWVGLRAGLDTEARQKILYLCWGSNPS